MKAIPEKSAFSRRLIKALQDAKVEITSPTQLAREFNKRFPDVAVSTYAARKWFHGEAIPTQDKIRNLARWLGVAPEWLRYGEREGRALTAQQPIVLYSASHLSVLNDYASLNEAHKEVVRELIALFMKQERQS
ncbi:MAG TPA: hypothetical protein VGK14_01025 [Novimethylophilus sp.]|jgi:transcriptional regulator with XRE-family HTH domain|uniref:hypothetical protein n=1 Tax=Novimethylophilus sp. TaxID=2137426 RepID=UPI002F41FE64